MGVLLGFYGGGGGEIIVLFLNCGWVLELWVVCSFILCFYGITWIVGLLTWLVFVCVILVEVFGFG